VFSSFDFNFVKSISSVPIKRKLDIHQTTRTALKGAIHEGKGSQKLILEAVLVIKSPPNSGLFIKKKILNHVFVVIDTEAPLGNTKQFSVIVIARKWAKVASNSRTPFLCNMLTWWLDEKATHRRR